MRESIESVRYNRKWSRQGCEGEPVAQSWVGGTKSFSSGFGRGGGDEADKAILGWRFSLLSPEWSTMNREVSNQRWAF